MTRHIYYVLPFMMSIRKSILILSVVVLVALLAYYTGGILLGNSTSDNLCDSNSGQDCHRRKTDSYASYFKTGANALAVVRHILFKMSVKEIKYFLIMVGEFDKYMAKIHEFMEDSKNYTGRVIKPFVQRRVRHSSDDQPLVLINPDELSFLVDDVGQQIRRQCGRASILVYVHSAVHHMDQRDVIRQTWGSETVRETFNMVVVFFVGRSLNSAANDRILTENSAHGDMVQGNFHDTYDNLTLKSIAALKWIHSHCRTWDLILKVDDDVFVNPVTFHKLLFKEIPLLYFNTDKMLLCNVLLVNVVIRESDSKWHVPMENYRYFNYPQYCQGSAYMMTSATAAALYEQSFGQEFLTFDDVLVTGMLAQKAGISFFPFNVKYLTSKEDHDLDTTLNYMNGTLVFSINPLNTRTELWQIVQSDFERLRRLP